MYDISLDAPTSPTSIRDHDVERQPESDYDPAVDIKRGTAPSLDRVQRRRRDTSAIGDLAGRQRPPMTLLDDSGTDVRGQSVGECARCG